PNSRCSSVVTPQEAALVAVRGGLGVLMGGAAHPPHPLRVMHRAVSVRVAQVMGVTPRVRAGRARRGPHLTQALAALPQDSTGRVERGGLAAGLAADRAQWGAGAQRGTATEGRA